VFIVTQVNDNIDQLVETYAYEASTANLQIEKLERTYARICDQYVHPNHYIGIQISQAIVSLVLTHIRLGWEKDCG